MAGPIVTNPNSPAESPAIPAANGVVTNGPAVPAANGVLTNGPAAIPAANGVMTNGPAAFAGFKSAVSFANGGVAAAVNSAVAVDSEMAVKKVRGRGRPRKYAVNGVAVSPSSAPPQLGGSVKKKAGRPRGSGLLQHLASIGGEFAETAGGALTPHIVTVQPGEDVMNKVMSFCQKAPITVCVLSCIGMVSHVILRNNGSLSRFEGQYEILSFMGSYTVAAYRRAGMFTVSLAKPDGKVIGGEVDGPLIAAIPVQLIVGTFKPNISKSIQKRHSVVPDLSGLPEQNGPVTTTNGPSDVVNHKTSNGIADNVVPATQNMTSAFSNGGINGNSQHNADHA